MYFLIEIKEQMEKTSCNRSLINEVNTLKNFQHPLSEELPLNKAGIIKIKLITP